MPSELLYALSFVLFVVVFLAVAITSIDERKIFWKQSILLLIPVLLGIFVTNSTNYKEEVTELEIYSINGVDFFIDGQTLINANKVLGKGFEEGDKIIKTELKEHYSNFIHFPKRIEYKVK